MRIYQIKPRTLIVKAFGRIKKYLHKLRPSLRELPDEKFYSLKWQGKLPDCSTPQKAEPPRFFHAVTHADDYIETLKKRFPREADAIVKRASDVLDHKFKVLGYDSAYLGDKIDWHRDFIHDKKWPKIDYRKIQIVDPANKSDSKILWELSRFQFSTDLARAYYLTGMDEFADKFVELVESWLDDNPVDVGINWVYSMEIAIRAVNIIWGIYMLAPSGKLTDDFIRRVVKNLYYHGLHIERNLETIGEGMNTNHLISNYVGLLYIGLLFPEFDRANEWQWLACNGLEKEMNDQVLDDGGDYENSTSYHRLVCEMFLSAFLLARHNAFVFSYNFRKKLEQMIKFSQIMTSASGTAPLIGDNDDGFLVNLSHRAPSDHRPLIDIGCSLMNIAPSIPIYDTEEKLWYLGPEYLNLKRSNREATPAFLRQSGYVVVNNEKFNMIFNAAEIHGNCLGGHKHNDLLSVLFEIDSIPVFIDAGTAYYTSDPALRNLSRSTSMHNTVTIDNKEQCRFIDGALFYLNKDAEAVIDLFTDTGDEVIVRGKHTGYKRLPDSPIHMRTVEISFNRRVIKITDEITGGNEHSHDIAVNYLTPLDCIMIDDTEVVLGVKRKLLVDFASDCGNHIKINAKQTNYYPRYGKAYPANMISCQLSSALPLKVITTVSFGYLHKGYHDNLEKAEPVGLRSF